MSDRPSIPFIAAAALAMGLSVGLGCAAADKDKHVRNAVRSPAELEQVILRQDIAFAKAKGTYEKKFAGLSFVDDKVKTGLALVDAGSKHMGYNLLIEADKEHRIDDTASYKEHHALALYTLGKFELFINDNLDEAIPFFERAVKYQDKWDSADDISLTALLNCSFAYAKTDPDKAERFGQAAEDLMVDISAAKADALLSRATSLQGLFHDYCVAGTPSVVMLSAEWCAPCKNLKESGTLDAALNTYHVADSFTELDTSSEEGALISAALDVNSIPAFFYLGPDCEVNGVHVGGANLDQSFRRYIQGDSLD